MLLWQLNLPPLLLPPMAQVLTIILVAVVVVVVVAIMLPVRALALADTPSRRR